MVSIYLPLTFTALKQVNMIFFSNESTLLLRKKVKKKTEKLNPHKNK